MPFLTTDDGVKLHYEQTGDGPAIIFVHEFAGDCRSWEAQLRHFGRRYRCIAFNARGFPPSEVPGPEHYSQARARDDILAVADALAVERAHVVGLSMGGFATLHFGLAYPDRAASLVVAGCGYGAALDRQQQFADEARASAARFESIGMAAAAKAFAVGPTRVQFQNRDPRGWQAFVEQMATHSVEGSARTMRGVQAGRPSLYELTDQLRALQVPTLVISGDEDWPCLEPALLLKRLVRTAGLAILPNAGHAINLECPAAFNALLDDFYHDVLRGCWPVRDPRAMVDTILGKDDE
ncbi:MAG: alpha/beta hydrolase [Burkholderiaceae bacterium]